MPHGRDLRKGTLELGDCPAVLPSHGDEHQGLEAETQGSRVDDGPVAANRSRALQFAQSSMAGRDAELHPLGQLGDGQPSIRLEFSNNLSIDGVHSSRILPKLALLWSSSQ